MAQNYQTVVTQSGLAKIAAAITGTGTISITGVAAGDGGGSPITAISTMTALVNQLWSGAPTSVSRNPAAPTQVQITFTIPSSIAPCTIREVGLFTSDGQLFAIAPYPDTDMITASQGGQNQIVVTMVFVASTAATVTIIINPLSLIPLSQLLRAPFIGIDSFTNTPPTTPAAGALNVVGPAPTGAFAGQANNFAQWDSEQYQFAAPPVLTIVGNAADGKYYRFFGGAWSIINIGGLGSSREPFIAVNAMNVAAPPANPADGDIYSLPANSTGAWSEWTGFAVWSATLSIWQNKPAVLGEVIECEADGTFWEMTAGGWVPFTATHTAPGLVTLSTAATVLAGIDDTTAVTPAGLRSTIHDALFNIASQSWTSPGTYSWTVPAGVTRIYGKCWSAGSSGGGAPANSFGASGGNGGGYAEGPFEVTPGQVIPIIVGRGGVSVTGASDGNVGGTSSIGTLCSAVSGAPGLQSSTTAPGYTPGAVGYGVGGQINSQGARGGQGGGPASAWTSLGGKGGGCGNGGDGGSGTTANGNDGAYPGGGGSGAGGNAGTAATSGRGADGGIIIEWSNA